MSPSRSTRCLWLAALVSLVGCGGGDDEPGSALPFRRVELRASADTRSDPLLLARVPAPSPDAAAPWTVVAARSRFGQVEPAGDASGGPKGGPVDAMILEGKGELKYVRAPIPEEARAFNHVVVEAAMSGEASEKIRLYLFRDGKGLTSPKIQQMVPVGGLQVVTFDVPELRGEADAPDEFGIAFDGRAHIGAVAAVSFVSVPTTRFAPPLEGEGELVRIGDDLRRALGVLPGAPLAGEFELRGAEELRLAVGAEPVLARLGETLTFELEVLRGDAEGSVARGSGVRWSKSIESSVDSGWSDIRIAAREIGEGRSELRVRVSSNHGDSDAVGLVSVPTVRRVEPLPAEPPPATVLLITSDTHRADHLGILGPDAPVSTPHLDALARRGVLFTNCVAPTNVTSPSHIALMTGIHPRDTGVLTNFDRLAQSASTLAEAFRDAGYETFAATSVQQLVDDKSGIGQGFDRMDGPDEGQRPGPEAIELLRGWIDDAGQAPVFAWLHLYDAHAPYSPPAPYSRRYYPQGNPFVGEDLPLAEHVIPAWAKRIKDPAFPYAQYRAEVDFVDGSLERILSIPRVAAGTIAFTADHGELFGEHGVWWSHAALYPGILRVPLIVAGPGAPTGARSDVPVELTDLGGTLLDLAGIERSIGGRNLLQRMESDPPAEPRFSLSAHHYSASIESDDWFLTLELQSHGGPGLERDREIGAVELYALSTDPDCERDLLLEALPRAKRLRAALIDWLDAAAGERLSETQQRTEEDESMLAALGYGGSGQSESAARYWNPERFAGSGWAASPWRRLFEDESFSVDDFRSETRR